MRIDTSARLEEHLKRNAPEGRYELTGQAESLPHSRGAEWSWERRDRPNEQLAYGVSLRLPKGSRMHFEIRYDNSANK